MRPIPGRFEATPRVERPETPFEMAYQSTHYFSPKSGSGSPGASIYVKVFSGRG